MQTALWYQGVAYANTKQYEKAEDTLAEAVELKPPSVDVYCDYALTFIVQKDYVDALDVLQTALLEIPNDKKLIGLREKASYDFFREAYDQHRKYPTSGVPYANAAYHWIVVGKLGDALESLNKSERLTPHNALVYRLRGELYHKQGQYKQAVADYDKALSLLDTEPTPIIWEEYVRARRAEALKQAQ
jgi:tetratricopeptide (TPR) repeat protein